MCILVPFSFCSTAEKNASLYNEGKIEECAGLEEGERVQAEGGEENKAIQEDKSNKIVITLHTLYCTCITTCMYIYTYIMYMYQLGLH